MSQYDFLTGLPNRMQLQQQLDQILEDAGRLQRRVAVLCVGLDDFKGINEQFSYQTGDQLLLEMYAAHLHERRQQPTMAMPRYLRAKINNRLCHQQMQG